MSLRHRTDKEPIELLLGLAGAVQYLRHTIKDQETYWVWVKTKLGDRQISIPIVAVQQIQFQKPNGAVIEFIRRQLMDELPSDATISYLPAATRAESTRWHRLLALLGLRK